MDFCSNINHFLLQSTGQSRADRLAPALDPTLVKIDDRNTATILDFLYRFSRQINYYDQDLTVGNWLPFFEKSLPVLLARIHHLEIVSLENDLQELEGLLNNQPEVENLRLLFDFIESELLKPVQAWNMAFQGGGTGFEILLYNLLSGNLQSPLLQFIQLSNGAQKWFCTGKRSFIDWQKEPVWNLSFTDIFSLDDGFMNAPGNTSGKVLALTNELLEIAKKWLEVIRRLQEQAIHYFEAALIPAEAEYRENHAPHLGLLFTFLRLFEHVQNDLNGLTTKHLDYFYKTVLHIHASSIVPDHAHIVFELQKQVENPYLLPKDLQLANGKDDIGEDIFYRLEEDIVLDKAQVKTVKTLFINEVKGLLTDKEISTGCESCEEETFVEGIYLAPVANKADGIEEDFQSEQKSWPTLGAKHSKYYEPDANGDLVPREYPAMSRLGFVLASPVLLLNEGQRNITIRLTCEVDEKLCKEETEEGFCCDKELEEANLNQLFNGDNKSDFWVKKEWYRFSEKTICNFIDTYKLKTSNQDSNKLKTSYEELLSSILDELELEQENQLVSLLNKTGGDSLFPSFDNFWKQLSVSVKCLPHGGKGISKKEKTDSKNTSEEENQDCQKIFEYEKAGNKLENLLLGSIRQILCLDAIGFLLDWKYKEEEEETTINTINTYIKEKFIEKFIKCIEEYASPIQYCQVQKTNTNESLFLIDFSGEKKWLRPADEAIDILFHWDVDSKKLEIKLDIKLTQDQPAITFFNADVLEECFDTIYPLVKIAVNPNCKIPCALPENASDCCLERCAPAGGELISIYHFLRHLVVIKPCIEVNVCGVKNVIVQNDENVQDVNEIVYPFGVRPTIESNLSLGMNSDPDLRGSNFYIGSKEILCKKWEKIWINWNWKDKPADITDYYLGYQDITKDLPSPTEEAFKLQVSVLEEKNWIKEKQGSSNPYTQLDTKPSKNLKYRPLFGTSRNYFTHCADYYLNKYDQSIQLEKRLFEGLSDNPIKALDEIPLERLDVDTRNAFLRFTLKCMDFQHSRYSFILARQMMAFGKFPEDYLHGAVYSYLDDNDIQQVSTLTLDEFNNRIKRKPVSVFDDVNFLQRICAFTGVLRSKTDSLVDKIKGGQDDVLSNLCDVILSNIEELKANLDDYFVNADASSFAAYAQGVLDVTFATGGDVHESIIIRLEAFITELSLDPATIDPSVISTKAEEIMASISAGIAVDVLDIVEHIKEKFDEIFSTEEIKKAIVDAFVSLNLATVDGDGNVEFKSLLVIDDEIEYLACGVFENNPECTENWNILDYKGKSDGGNQILEEYVIEITKAQELCEILHAPIFDVTALVEAIEILAPLAAAGDNTNFLTDVIKNLGIADISKALDAYITTKKNDIDGAKATNVIIPNEPYTPMFNDIALDYIAYADYKDIELFHLLPDEKAYEAQPLMDETETAINAPLLPTYTNQGSLFIGFENLRRGSVVNLLFQLAEATADTESKRADLKWYYIKDNTWTELLDGFQILEDGTDDFTRSGIVKIAIPEDMDTEDFSIMPAECLWLKVATKKNVAAVAETIGLHTQAVRVIYDPTPDNVRTQLTLEAGQINKLAIADANIKSVNQFYPTFDGRAAELGNHFYTRVSEQLRHKGRAINRYDYERLVLEQFIEIDKVKCISHSLGLSANQYKVDLNLAPGHVIIAVIPDLKKVVGSDSSTPRVPSSLLDEVRDFLKKRHTPFIHVEVRNPRYERVNMSVTVRFRQKNPTFFKDLLKKDLQDFLAPWQDGRQEDLCFGRTISRSSMIGFIEDLNYVDYVCDLRFRHEYDLNLDCTEQELSTELTTIFPMTPRSILTAGKVEILDIERDCEIYDDKEKCGNPLEKVANIPVPNNPKFDNE